MTRSTTSKKRAFAPPYKKSEVRPDFWAGVWDYAVGRPAWEHPRYEEALRRIAKLPAERQFSPWWVRTWADVVAVLHGCWFSFEEGDRVCRFFERVLRHTKNSATGEPSGRAVELMDWARWQFVLPLFGWRRTDGTRRFRKCLMWIPKKNAKSFHASGLGLYFLTKDNEDSAEVYAAAASKDQAGNIWNEAANMVRRAASRKFKASLGLHESRKSIVYETKLTRSVFKALAAEVETAEGINASALFFDEVHVQQDRTFFETLVYSGTARRQPMLMELSTAGVYRPESIGWEEFTLASKIHAGELEDPWTYVFIAKAATKDEWFAEVRGRDDDWRDPRILKKANPSWGITFQPDTILAECKEAVEIPRKQPAFKRYKCNLWVRAAARWMDARTWSACATTLEYEDYVASLAGLECYGGLDLSLAVDITAFVLWFKPQAGCSKHRLLPFFWLPEDNLEELEKAAKAPYHHWIDQGYLRKCSGNWIDYAQVHDEINELGKLYKIQAIGYDPWKASEMVQGLTNDGHQLLEVRQVMSVMSGPTEAFDGRARRGELEHGRHPVFDWQMSNAQALYDSRGNYYITKGDGKVRHKVDGVVAAIMAGGTAHDPSIQPKKPSVYESRGLRQL